jgi:hypothetical protein
MKAKFRLVGSYHLCCHLWTCNQCKLNKRLQTSLLKVSHRWVYRWIYQWVYLWLNSSHHQNGINLKWATNRLISSLEPSPNNPINGSSQFNQVVISSRASNLNRLIIINSLSSLVVIRSLKDISLLVINRQAIKILKDNTNLRLTRSNTVSPQVTNTCRSKPITNNLKSNTDSSLKPTRCTSRKATFRLARELWV